MKEPLSQSHDRPRLSQPKVVMIVRMMTASYVKFHHESVDLTLIGLG